MQYIKEILYWPSLFNQNDWILALFYFCILIDVNPISVHKHANEELGQYPAILTSHLVNNPYILPEWELDFKRDLLINLHVLYI